MRLATAALRRGLVLALLWWVLVEGREGYAGYGALAVAAALASSLWVAPPGHPRPAPAGVASRGRGLARLVGWYAVQVVRGGVDVAGRVLRSPVDVHPVVVEARSRLPEGPLRQLAVAMFGLMPGSLVVGADGPVVRLHSLAAELEPLEQWERLEGHLAAAGGVGLPTR